MPFTGKVGDTLYLRDAGGSHRYVVLTEPNENGEVVIVNFTSARSWKDNSAVFRPRDDKTLFEVETFIRFSDARLVLQDRLKKIKEKDASRYRYCAEGIIERIVIGAFVSDFTPIEILEELKNQYPAEYKIHCAEDY